MKTFRLIRMVVLTAVIGTSFMACNEEYDDSSLTNRVDILENRVSKLEDLCKQINANISSLQTMVSALENSDYITNVTPVTKDGQEIGYTIAFAKSQPITIYHGENGANGKDGQDGLSPAIGVKNLDGVYYWTLNDEWLLDDGENKIPAIGFNGQDGKDGITPQVKIEDDYWYVSYDEGLSWKKLEKATTVADNIFKEVIVTDNAVIVTLNNNTSFTLLRNEAVNIAFDIQEQGISAGSTVQIPYTLQGATEKTIVTASSDGNYKVKVEEQTINEGLITVTAPDPYVDGYVNILVSDGNGYTVLKVINFYEWKMEISSTEESLTYSIPTNGGEVSIPLSINFDYDVEIPADAADWVSVAINSRAAIRNESLLCLIKPNTTDAVRSCVIRLLPKNGTKALAQIRIQQRSQTKTQVEKVFPNHLLQQVDDMTFTYSNGFLTKITRNEEIITFAYNYPAKSRAADEPEVIATHNSYTIEAWLNAQGFAEEIHQTNFEYGYTYSSSKKCQYDSEGHLIFMKDSREDREYTITWENGNIIQIQTKRFSDNGGIEWERLQNFDYYQDENQYNILLYYYMFSVDIDEVDCLYWAGYLGKAPKNQVKSMSGNFTYSDGFSHPENYSSTWDTNRVMIGGKEILFQ